MKFDYITAAMKAGGLTHAQKSVLLAYCIRADDYGYSYPGRQRIADDMGMSPRTVTYAKSALIKMGLIINKARVDQHGRQIADLVRVDLAAVKRIERAPRIYKDNVIEEITLPTEPHSPESSQDFGGAPLAPPNGGEGAPLAPRGCTSCTPGGAPLAPKRSKERAPKEQPPCGPPLASTADGPLAEVGDAAASAPASPTSHRRLRENPDSVAASGNEPEEPTLPGADSYVAAVADVATKRTRKTHDADHAEADPNRQHPKDTAAERKQSTQQQLPYPPVTYANGHWRPQHNTPQEAPESPSRGRTGTGRAKGKGQRQKAAETPLPEDFRPTDAMRRWAEATYPAVDLDYETAQFISHYRSKPNDTRGSWPDVWQSWIRRANKITSGHNTRQRPVPRTPDGTEITHPDGTPLVGADLKMAQALAAGARLAALREAGHDPGMPWATPTQPQLPTRPEDDPFHPDYKG